MLAVDVDGVISLFGFDGPITDAPGRFHLIDGIAHCISDVAAGDAAAPRPRSTSSSGRPDGRSGPTTTCR